MKHNYYSSLILCALIILIFLLQNFPGITDTFILDNRVVATKPWTLFTAIFLHSDTVHLLYNLFGLALFGSILEHIIGTKRFLRLFIVAGIIASIVSVPFYTRVLGASGAIFGVIGALGILRPKMAVWVYGMPMPMFVALIVWALADLLGILAPSGTANIAHLGGLVYGIIYGFYVRINFKEKKPKKEHIYIDEQKVKEWEKNF